MEVAESAREAGQRKRRRTALLIFLVCLAVYNSNCRLLAAGDSIPARLIPFAILNHGTVFLDAYGPFPKGTWWIQRGRSRHLTSVFPIVLPVLITPLYVPAAVYVRVAHPPPWRFATLCGVMEKACASLIASLSVVLFLFALRSVTSEPTAVLLAVTYAFGTETWAISSQGLWQHGMGELLLVLALWLLTREHTPMNVFAAGVLFSLLTFNRPPDFFLALAFGVSYLWRRQREVARFLIGVIAAGTPLLIYNFVAFHRPTGGYGLLIQRALVGHSVSTRAESMLAGAAALLVSPGKGLLVYCPFLLFLIGAPLLKFPERGRLPTLLFGLAFVAQVLLYSFWDWRAGWCYGPRFLTDCLPFLVMALVPVVEKLRPPVGKPAFLLCVGFSVIVQAIGVFCYPGGGSVFLTQEELWKPSGAQFYREARVGFPRPEYFYKMRRWLGISSETSSVPVPRVR